MKYTFLFLIFLSFDSFTSELNIIKFRNQSKHRYKVRFFNVSLEPEYVSISRYKTIPICVANPLNFSSQSMTIFNTTLNKKCQYDFAQIPFNIIVLTENLDTIFLPHALYKVVWHPIEIEKKPLALPKSSDFTESSD